MSALELTAVFLTLVAAASWINARWLRLPNAVAMLLAGAAIPALQPVLDRFGVNLAGLARQVDFPQTVTGFMLSFLLFAGATQVDFAEMRRRWASVLSLATLGVIASTLLVGGGLWLAAHALKLDLPLSWAFAFGALISPTDPVAVLAAAKGQNLPTVASTVLQGEALFNDGAGITAFAVALGFLNPGPDPNLALASALAVAEAIGGLLIGLLGGRIVVRLMRAVDDPVVGVSLSLALAAGAYALAQALHLSGPVAAVAAGLVVGEVATRETTAETMRRHLTGFWTLVDEILNALLFLLLGLQLLVVPFRIEDIGLWAIAAVLVLGARLLVVLPWGVFFSHRHGERGATGFLVWGGLHGALSVALALTLPDQPARGLVLSVTYAVVVFSLVVQGLSFGPLARRIGARSGA